MFDATYCAITFAPVQGFIEKSRKLRDLYGSSYILSYLAATICTTAGKNGWELISPALPNITKGTPNQIILKDGEGRQHLRPSEAEAELQTAFNAAWQRLVIAVRENLEHKLRDQDTDDKWKRSWEAWGNYAWEWFCVIGQPGESITQVRQQLNEVKRSRNWIGVNWQGESSTLSGSDAIAWPGMDVYSPKEELRSERDNKIEAFYARLTQHWHGKIIDEREHLSIPDLVKRFATLQEIAETLELDPTDYPNLEPPERFTDLNRLDNEQYTAWFMGDGDKIGDYLKQLQDAGIDEGIALSQLSEALTTWGDRFAQRVRETVQVASPLPPKSQIIYAGGDDFLGVLYRTDITKLHPSHWLSWLYTFQTLWGEHRDHLPREHQTQPALTVSMGLVWAAPGVPQRDVLQHCREAERSAKSQGRNRVAIRILFNSGTHLEWACPWSLLEPIFTAHCNWTHFQRDIAALQARHALEVPRSISEAEIKKHTKIAQAILQYHLNLPNEPNDLHEPDRQLWESVMERDRWCTQDAPHNDNDFGILPPKPEFKDSERSTQSHKIAQAFNDWVVALANVGFRLDPEAQQKLEHPQLTTA